MSDSRRPRTLALPRRMPPLALLAICVLLTVLVGVLYHEATEERDVGRFELAVQTMEDRIGARLDTYVALLFATRGFMEASRLVEADEFRRFVSEAEIATRYPGLQGIGYTRRFAWSDRASVEAEVRAVGQAGFRVWPETPRAEGHAIVFLEPLDRRNRVAIGYDMATDPVRRDAMERARDTGGPAASGPVVLLQEIDQDRQMGFLVYVPLYAGGMVPSTLAERREQIAGFVYSPLRVEDFMAGIFGRVPDPRVALLVSDEVDGQRTEMYRSSGFTGAGRLSALTRLPVAGRTWTLSFETTRAFESGSGTWFTPYLLVLGGLLSAIFYGQARRQRRADDQLRLHSQILSDMTEGVSVSDERGYILYTNAAEDRMFGYAPGELVGKHVTVLNAYPPEENQRVVGEVVRVLHAEGMWNGEFENVRKDGTRFVTAAHIVRFEVKGVPCWICVQADITDRKRAEREREELLERERTSRAAAEDASRVKDEFLAMLGHELRNPLAPIVTVLELLRRRGHDRDPSYAVIDRQVRHLQRLVDDLLDVSRITRGRISLDKRRVEVATVVRDAVEMVTPLLEQKRHTLDVQVPPGLAVTGDRGRLAQILGNLLVNAAKYTRPGGRISVAGAREGQEVVLIVRDNGMGIPPDILPHIFDLFAQGPRTTDRSEGGLGIGLAVVRGLLELHGGRIVARSEGVGQGSEFEVHLPAANAPSEPAAVEPSSAPVARAPRGLHVLVVDDNEDAAETLAELLTEAGHEVAVARDAPEALERCDHRRPEVAILDIGLPVMDGYELAARLPEPKPVLIALTGYGGDFNRERSAKAGFLHHFAKPVEPGMLLDALADVARRGTALNADRSRA